MKDNRSYIGVGALLVAVGALLLLQNFGLFSDLSNLIWVILFGAGGLAFLYVFAANRANWWAIIPGFTLLGLAALIAAGDRLGALGGAMFLGAIGLSFWVIYAVKREFWWAVIPGGTLLTLAAVAALADVLPGLATGGVFFLGLGVTFFLVYILPTPEGRMTWALIPGGILALVGVLMTLSIGGIINYVWPAALILAGAFVLLRTYRRR